MHDGSSGTPENGGPAGYRSKRAGHISGRTDRSRCGPHRSPRGCHGRRGPPRPSMPGFGPTGPRTASRSRREVRTSRTLSVSVPSRSQRPARRCGGFLAAATARGAGDDRLGDRQRDLLRDAAIARLLTDAHEGRELVVERVYILETRIHDLEAEVRQRVTLCQAVQHHLADTSRCDLGCSALLHIPFEIIDEPVDFLAGERFRRGFSDRARELPSVELLAAAVPL